MYEEEELLLYAREECPCQRCDGQDMCGNKRDCEEFQQWLEYVL